MLIGSVRDSRRINMVFEKYKPEIVYHAAAHKHVPLMETSPNESIKNNVIGTYKTAYAALKHGASRFILISTDKAVNPTNIMGASKRLCEMVIQSMDAVSKAGRMDVLPLLHAHMDKYFEDQIPGDRTTAAMKSRPEERSSVHMRASRTKIDREHSLWQFDSEMFLEVTDQLFHSLRNRSKRRPGDSYTSGYREILHDDPGGSQPGTSSRNLCLGR